MKRFLRIAAALLAALMIICSVTGCSKTVDYEKYSTTVAATYGDQKIYMDEANFMLNLQRWAYEDAYWYYYYQYYGVTDMWSTASPDGSNKTFGEYLRETNMAALIQCRIINDHAAELGVSLTEADEAKIAANTQELRDTYAEELFTKYAPVTDEQINEWTRTNALANKVMDAVKKQAQIDISLGEIDTMSVSYCFITEKDSTSSESSEEAPADPAIAALEKEPLANAVLAKLQEGESLTDIAETYTQINPYDQTYLVAETDTDTFVKKSALTMNDGESKIFYSEGSGWYVIKLHHMHDEEATASKRASVEDSKRTDHFNEVLQEWTANAPAYKVNSCYEDLKVTGLIFVYKEESDTTSSAG